MVAKTKEDVMTILREHLPNLSRQYGVEKIGIFGSFSRNRQRAESDVDVVVRFEQPIGLKFVDFADHLESLLGRQADILTLDGMRAIRNEEISRAIEGSIVYV